MEGGERPPVEITIRRVESEGRIWRWHDVFALHFGDRLIEAIYTGGDDGVIVRWIQDVHRVHRERLRGGRCGDGSRDLVVGLCTFRRRPCFPTNRELRAARGDYPISVMSLCAGGTHCLVVPVDDGYPWRRGRLPHALAAFLADQRSTFVGIGIKKAAERLERDCGVHVANATELRPLVAGAFGRQAVPPFKGGGGDADGLRKMAKVALGGIDAGKKPAAIEFHNWDLGDSDDHVMYAAVDAFLTSEVAEACLDAIHTRGSYDTKGVF